MSEYEWQFNRAVANAESAAERGDEWDDSAENEPTDAKREWFDARMASLLADITEDADEELAELEWARALMEEEDGDLNDRRNQ